MIEKTFDNVVSLEENGEMQIKAWVREDGLWTFREVTEAEFNSIAPLLQFDLSWLKKVKDE